MPQLNLKSLNFDDAHPCCRPFTMEIGFASQPGGHWYYGSAVDLSWLQEKVEDALGPLELADTVLVADFSVDSLAEAVQGWLRRCDRQSPDASLAALAAWFSWEFDHYNGPSPETSPQLGIPAPTIHNNDDYCTISLALPEHGQVEFTLAIHSIEELAEAALPHHLGHTIVTRGNRPWLAARVANDLVRSCAAETPRETANRLARFADCTRLDYDPNPSWYGT